MSKESFVYALFNLKPRRGIVTQGTSKQVDKAKEKIDSPTDLPDQIASNYEILSQAGEGTYGVVYKAIRKHDSRQVALKKLRLNLGNNTSDNNLTHTGVPTSAVREVSLLRELKHPNVVELIDVVFTPVQLWLVFEYCQLDLRMYIKTFSKATSALPLNHCRHFARHILQGLKFAHSLNVLHRDMKPGNILLSLPHHGISIDRLRGKHTDLSEVTMKSALKSCNPAALMIYEQGFQTTAKIGDLGLARSNQNSSAKEFLTQEVVTMWYRAPELLLGVREYSSAIDMWSFGCILAEMAGGKPLFPGDSDIDTLFKMFALLGTPTAEDWPEGISLPWFQERFPKWTVVDRIASLGEALKVDEKDLLELIIRCLDYRAEERLSAAEALKHVWLHHK